MFVVNTIINDLRIDILKICTIIKFLLLFAYESNYKSNYKVMSPHNSKTLKLFVAWIKQTILLK